MAVFLPALLALSYAFIESSERRESRFLLAAVVGVGFSLTVVHIREIIQYLSYLGCFVLIGFAVRPFQAYARRAVVLMGVTIAVAAVYLVWQRAEVGHVTTLVADERRKVAAIAAATSWRDLFLAHAPAVLPNYEIGRAHV